MNQDEQRDYGGAHDRAANIFLVTLCLSFQAVPLAGVALFLPLIRNDLNLSFTQGGALAAARTLTYALMQIPAGYLADRYGLRKVFFIGVLGSTVLGVTFGLVAGYWQALLNQAATGFFNALLFISALALLASWFGAQRRATAMALPLIGLLAGTLAINTIGPPLAEQFNWRIPFISFAATGILASFTYLWLAKEAPHAGSRQKLSVVDALRLFRSRFMWACGVVQYVRLGVVQGTAFWLPSLLIDEKGLSLQATGLIIAFWTLISAPSNIIGGYMSDRLKKPTLIIGISLIILAVTTAALVNVDKVAPLTILLLINGAFIQFYFGPLFAVPLEKYGAHMTGTLSGFGNFFANVGAFTLTYLLGVLKDQSGFFESGFYALAGVCLLGLMFTILLEKIRD
ncbi:MAG: MFS transporter [Deltaproteobacteria bacterium]|nr:MFS transporter [Deltaproteobacteria bacterium]